MNNTKADRWPLWLSFPIVALLAVASMGGLLLPVQYGQETRMRAVQFIGNDAGNLLFIAPTLITAAVMNWTALAGTGPGRRGSPSGDGERATMGSSAAMAARGLSVVHVVQ